ncbi:unnamed protein product [Caenorhabditis brenneri]
MNRPPEMIKCGWKDCENWFSTGIDMNQHVLINHIKFMKVQFVEPDSATVVPKVDPQQEPKTSKHPPRILSHLLQTPPQPIRIQHQHHQIFQPPPPPPQYPPMMPPPPTAPSVQNYPYFDDDEDVIIEEKPTSTTSSTSRDGIPDEPKQESEQIGHVVRQSTDEDEIELDSPEKTPERSGVEGPSPAKKARSNNGDGADKAPWSVARNCTHAIDPMIRLTSSYGTIGQMAKAITDELVTRKTLRRKNRANGLYCIVCLDYRRDDGFCDFMHNNQQNHFIRYYTTLYHNDQIRKLTIVQQLTEMQQIEDFLPEMTTNYVDLNRGPSQFL